MTKLFTPIEIAGITLKNRIGMSPMCMYSSTNKDGHLTPFHMTHYTSRALGQVGLIIVEATAIDPDGRISEEDLGIWDDEHRRGFTALNEQLHTYGAKTAIQLAHAGRKSQVPPPIYAPSAVPFDEHSECPQEMTTSQIEQTIQSFQDGALRAKQSGFDIIEIHAAHGYLINEFLSPLINQRTDAYGGSREKRYRFLQEIISAVQEVWDGPLFVRISTNEYHHAGNTMDDILYFTKRMKDQGIHLIDCSSGGVVPASIKTFPGYQVKRCEIIKRETEIKTGAVGLITSGLQAEEILQNKRADLIFVGRPLLKNPHWVKQVADELAFDLEAPEQYARGWN